MDAEKWYTRPIFSVSDMGEALRHYCDRLGFSRAWAYEEEGKTIVTQVNMGQFELILTSNLDRVGLGRIFVSLEKWEVVNLAKRIDESGIQTEQFFWGYPSIRIQDPDGNEMIIPQEFEEE